ncbi:MAG: hypothetical protein WAM66_15130 [Acidobacteriaceae bacterium]
MRTSFCLLIALSSATLWAAAQQCPTENTDVPASVTGALEYHSGVYAWYGLRPTHPVCGQKVIQLGLNDKGEFRAAHQFVGCEVTVTGNLFVPDTGYWSAPLGITDAHIRAAKTCKPGKPLPDYSTIPIPSALHRYKVAATYTPKTFTFSAQVHDASSGQSLSPWQRYASDTGNGGRDLQRMFCADGFLASDPKNALNQPDLQANVDPGLPQAIEVAIPSELIVQVSFVCTRSASAKNSERGTLSQSALNPVLYLNHAQLFGL